MELYREFFSLIEALNREALEYSVVGGIALAFHSQPRFTRDIDLLCKLVDLESYRKILGELGYCELSKPWTFQNTNITLHRFGKKCSEADEELLVVDLLIGNEDRHAEIIEKSITDESPAGRVRLARREDLIWMKQIRGSKQDEADIDNLEKGNEQN